MFHPRDPELPLSVIRQPNKWRLLTSGGTCGRKTVPWHATETNRLLEWRGWSSKGGYNLNKLQSSSFYSHQLGMCIRRNMHACITIFDENFLWRILNWKLSSLTYTIYVCICIKYMCFVKSGNLSRKLIKSDASWKDFLFWEIPDLIIVPFYKNVNVNECESN